MEKGHNLLRHVNLYQILLKMLKFLKWFDKFEDPMGHLF